MEPCSTENFRGEKYCLKSMRIMLYLLILPFFNNLFLTQALYLCASVTKDLD